MSVVEQIKKAAASTISELYTIPVHPADIPVNATKTEFEGDYTVVLFALVKQLKSDLPDYYSIGLLGYCKDDKVKHTWCSAPKTSFAFNLSNILGSISSDLEKVIPGITKSTLQGYHKVSKAVIWLYIFGLSSTVFSIFCAARAVFFSGGRKLLVLSCTVSS